MLAPKHVLYEGRYLPLTPKESELLYELAKLGGRTVSAAILGGWLSATENPSDLAQVMVCKIRKALRGVVPCPIETDFARGYRWRELA